MPTTRSAQELMPWLVPITDGIVATKDSGLLATFEFDGIDTDGAPAGSERQLELTMDAAMATWRDQPVSIWWTLRRERTTDYPGAPMPDSVSQMIDDEQREIFLQSGGFVNRYFVSVLWVPQRNTETAMQRIAAYTGDGMSFARAAYRSVRSMLSTRETFAWTAAELEQTIETYEGLLDQFSGILGLINPTRLRGDEQLGVLWALANPGLPLAPKEAPHDGRMLDALLPERTIDTYRDTLVFDQGTSDATYLSALSIKTFPDAFPAGALDALLVTPCEAVYTVAFRVGDTKTTEKRISTAKTMANLTKFPVKALVVSAFRHGEVNEEQADPSKAEDVMDALEATGELSSGRRFFGWLNTTLCFYHHDYDELSRITSDALRAVRGARFAGAVREGTHLLSAWTVTLPGSWEECRRWYYMSDANCSDLAPVVSVVSGERWNDHYSEQFGGLQPALSVFPTDYATPFYFNFHSGQSSHTFVVGPTRSGKSTGMNFLISQFQKYAGAQTFIFDRDLSCRIPTLLQGGTHIDFRPGQALQMNPIALVSDRAHWPFIAQWVEFLAAARGYNVTAEDSTIIWHAIETTAADKDLANRRLMGVYTQVLAQSKPLAQQLASWVEGGEYGSMFDNVEDSFSLSRFSCIEMGSVMQQPKLAAALMDYLFYRIEDAVRPKPGEPLRPTLLYVEEASFLMQVEQFALRLIGWLKTFAKLNGTVVLTTQSPEDYTDAAVARTFAAIRDNMTTRLYLPNPNATSEGLMATYTKTFQLQPEQVERIAMALPQRQYFITKPGVARMVNLRLSKRQVAALRSDAKAQRMFDEHWQNGQAAPGWQQRYIDAILALN